MQGQLFSTYEVSRPSEPPKPGSTTWRKGERCIVLDSQKMDYGTMVRVIFPSDGREGIFKATELGLSATEIATVKS
jgi:hypothetical protein